MCSHFLWTSNSSYWLECNNRKHWWCQQSIGSPTRWDVLIVVSFESLCFKHYVFPYRVAATIDVKLRPKGLGLGADRSVLDAATAVAQNEEAKGQAKLELRNGAYVQVGFLIHFTACFMHSKPKWGCFWLVRNFSLKKHWKSFDCRKTTYPSS